MEQKNIISGSDMRRGQYNFSTILRIYELLDCNQLGMVLECLQ